MSEPLDSSSVRQATKQPLKEHKVVDIFDSLTGLLGRKPFFRVIDDEIEKSKLGCTSLALLIIDIVGLRRINLAAGIDAGDAVLCETANRIRESLRNCDSVARMSGGEFAALLPSMISEDHPILAIDKILQAFHDPIELQNQKLNVELRFGVALYPNTCSSTEQLVRHATTALLHATARSRSFSVYCEESKDKDLAEYAFALELRTAVEQNQLALHYQPKWDIKAQEVTAAEALVRWPHREHGFISPNKFIPIAEESDLIRPLTAWVINEAVRQTAEWHREALPIGISVNLSARLLQDPEVPEIVKNALDIWSVKPEYLTLEVTETAIMENRDQGAEILDQLNDLGISISIDDFGAGYSSFAYLCDLPVEELKVDRSIITGAAANTDSETVLRTIIDLGHNLGLLVTAEGVEDEDKYRSLERLGCDIIQGYLISRPLAADDFLSFMMRKRQAG